MNLHCLATVAKIPEDKKAVSGKQDFTSLSNSWVTFNIDVTILFKGIFAVNSLSDCRSRGLRFEEIDHEIISSHSPFPLIQERHLSAKVCAQV